MLSTPGPTQRGNVCEWTHTDGIRKTLPRLHCRLWLPEFILPALELIADFWTTVFRVSKLLLDNRASLRESPARRSRICAENQTPGKRVSHDFCHRNNRLGLGIQLACCEKQGCSRLLSVR
jgi:hypothetical protein